MVGRASDFAVPACVVPCRQLYNGNPTILKASYPPVLALHSDVDKFGNGGSLLRVMELYLSSGVPLNNLDGSYVTGCAQTYSANLLVSSSVPGGGNITAFLLSDIQAAAGAPNTVSVRSRPWGLIS